MKDEKPKFDVKYSNSLEKAIIATAIYLHGKGLTEGPLLDGGFPNLSVFINAEPKSYLLSFYINSDSPFLPGSHLYFGANK